MASEIDTLKTNEFLRRRKLRLQQVREQSKDIAKKIRQRAKVEKLRHVTDIDAQKEKEYLDCQEKLVKRLELLYAKSLENVGSSHKSACDIQQDDVEKKDLSKLHGKEAVAELRKRRQAQLDEQKKVLDRKLQAREIANELSREKSSVVKNLAKQSLKKKDEPISKDSVNFYEINKEKDTQNKETDNNSSKAKADMGTQWECDELLNEWEHNVPALSLPKEDNVKDTVNENEKSDKNKKLDLFALSDEMPSSLRGGLTNVPEDIVPMKPSLSLVSEYLQNRNLKLRQPELNKKPAEDLQSIKQTILRTRSSKADVKEKSSRSTESEICLSRKKSVSVYNHNTRDILDMPCDKDKFVYRDNRTDEDAYAQALKETNSVSNIESEQLNKKQEDLRNKIAITRQNVDKEYRDTLAFLNSLPKETGSKPNRKMYMDGEQQQLLKDRHQRKLQQEYKKIEKECLKHNCKHSKRKSTVLDKSRSKSKSPVITEELDGRDFEYSWMPVPESDGSLAIHTIPNTRKQGNSVKFSGTDSYHEYRSRHKHTPPTKEVDDDRPNKRVVETVILQNESENESSLSSETSSVENLSLERDKSVSKVDSKIQDAERIIIYKILNSRKDKKSKNKRSEVSHKSANHKNLDSIINIQDSTTVSQNVDKTVMVEPKGVSFDQMHEGVYKAVSKDGDNITSMYFSEEPNVNKRNDYNTGVQNTEDKTDQFCSCGKNQSKTQQQKDIDKEVGDNAPRLTDLSNCKCVNVGIESSNLTQSSAATSTTSFKTAPNKANNDNPDGGFLKLLDEGATETGKFYIGASGFIKDDNYEVVIQLRKKEAEKTINKEVKDVVLPETPVKASTVDENKINSADKCMEKESAECSKPSDVTVDKETTTEKSCTETTLQKEEQKSHEQNEVQSKTRNMCEKAVHTLFQDTYPIPMDAPKTDPIQRPATSTYTQTSFNSSIQRPVFMHMSSSTSTAYMSPPELILPKFLRNGYVLSHEEMYESENTIHQLESQYEEIETRSCRKYKDCKSKHCTCSVKGTLHKKRYQTRKKMDTPPNTARNNRSFNDSNEIKKHKCKCHKCKSRNETKICSKSHRKRLNSSLYTKSSKELIEVNAKSPVTQSSKHKVLKGPIKNKPSESKINPVLKNYVHKLLALNKEGLKAVEIINQDCSIPTTPGSSIINLPSNNALTQRQSCLDNKISLEQIKNILRKQILKDHFEEPGTGQSTSLKHTESQIEKAPITTVRLPKKKPLHKVKSLNISRQFQKRKKCDAQRSARFTKTITSTSSSTREEKKVLSNEAKNVRSRSKSSPTPRPYVNSEYKNSTSSDITDRIPMKNCKEIGKTRHIQVNTNSNLSENSNSKHPGKSLNLPAPNILKSMSSDSEIHSALLKRLNVQQIPSNISTQTKGLIDTEINFMKIAEDKLQNMEKIADLTDRCTKRLSNLAKVLEEVRRNKSLVYSQISTSDSTSEPESKSDKNKIADTHRVTPHEFIQDKEITQTPSDTPPLTLPPTLDEKTLHKKDSLEFTPFLKDIPKPNIFKTPSNKTSSLNDMTKPTSILHTDHMDTKTRGRPPPALTRHLKNGQETVIPHELSTVIEVDSPMSIKLKNQSSRHDTKVDMPDKTKRFVDETDNISCMTQTMIDGCTENKEQQVNPELLQRNVNLEKALRFASSSNESSDDSKVRMMNMKHFNNIMLKPFISLQDYAKQCNIGLDEGSNLEDAAKAEAVNDDLSSLHSDGSLPDVIAELLKRNIISEPFKFDTGSNVNSTTISSESTLSLIALSKARKDKKKSGVFLKNKENMEETSETLSVSSNPDLENAFKKLGMGWASSTLKKTKETLALSSSSNTSSCSMTQFKIKSFSQDVPVFASDSTSSLVDDSNKREKRKLSSGHVNENSKNAVQQTSLTNSMTVKEFLTNVLANKITFSNKSNKNETDRSQPEFISLYETNIPEDMKLTNVRNEEDQSSVSSANNNRARTSTPVQIFKSTAYQSSSSSNTSNGLFSNADDLSSVKVTSTSIRNHSTSDKDELTIPNYSLRTKKGFSDRSKSD
ncbi:unnamed protein product, partial [Brenthis ino]